MELSMSIMAKRIVPTVFLCAVVFFGAQPRSVQAADKAQGVSCFLDTAVGRWNPGSAFKVTKIEGGNNSPTMRFAGYTGKTSVVVTDIKCDSRVLEYTLSGPIDDDFLPLVNIAKEIEFGANVVNIKKLSKPDLVKLLNTGEASWKSNGESGEFHVIRSDVSVVMTAYFLKEK